MKLVEKNVLNVTHVGNPTLAVKISVVINDWNVWWILNSVVKHVEGNLHINIVSIVIKILKFVEEGLRNKLFSEQPYAN